VTDAAKYVTPEILDLARRTYLTAPASPEGAVGYLRAALEAVAGDIAAAVRRECAAEMTWLDRQDGIGDYWMRELREAIERWEP